MKWAIQELNKFRGKSIEFDETLMLKARMQERDAEILDLTPVKVQGYIKVNETEYVAEFHIETTMTLPSSRSLEPVLYPIDLTISEIYMTPQQYNDQEIPLPEEEVLILETDTLDLQTAVEDHLLLSIPLQILTEEEKAGKDLPKGNGWEIVTEDDLAEKESSNEAAEIDPRLAKLSELLKPEDDK